MKNRTRTKSKGTPFQDDDGDRKETLETLLDSDQRVALGQVPSQRQLIQKEPSLYCLLANHDLLSEMPLYTAEELASITTIRQRMEGRRKGPNRKYVPDPLTYYLENYAGMVLEDLPSGLKAALYREELTNFVPNAKIVRGWRQIPDDEADTIAQFRDRYDLTAAFGIPREVAWQGGGAAIKAREYLADNVARHLVQINGKIISRYRFRTGKNPESMTRQLERICSPDAPVTAIVRNHFSAVIPSCIDDEFPAGFLQQDLSYFLTTVGYFELDEERVRRIIDVRERHLNQIRREICWRYFFQQSLFHYVATGGSLDAINVIEDLMNAAMLNPSSQNSPTNPLDGLRNSTLYTKGGYSSYAFVLNLVHGYNPTNQDQLYSLRRNVLSLHKEYTADKCAVALDEVSLLMRDIFRYFDSDFTLLDDLTILTGSSAKAWGTSYQDLQSKLNSLLGITAEAVDKETTKNSVRFTVGALRKKIGLEELTEILSPHFNSRERMGHIGETYSLACSIAPDDPDFPKSALERAGTEALQLGEEKRQNTLFLRTIIAGAYTYKKYLMAGSLEGLIPSDLDPKILEAVLKKRYVDEGYSRLQLPENRRSFLDYIVNLTRSAEKYGLAKVNAIDDLLIAMNSSVVYAPKQRAGESIIIDQPPLRESRENIFKAIASYQGAQCLVVAGERNYLLEFIVRASKITDSKRVRQELFKQYLERAAAVSFSSDNEQQFASWHEKVIASSSPELMGVTLRVHREEDVLDKIVNLADIRDPLQKKASLYAAGPVVVLPSVGISTSLALPVPHGRYILLPEFIGLFESPGENEAIYDFLTYLQSACFRYHLFTQTDEHLSPSAPIDTTSYPDFSNPSYAHHLNTVLQYVRAVNRIKEEHPKLYDRAIEPSLQRIQQYSQAKTLRDANISDGSYLILDMLWQYLLFGIERDHLLFEFVRDNLTISSEEALAFSNTQARQRLKQWYTSIAEKINLSVSSSESTIRTADTSDTELIVAQVLQGEYLNQATFEYPELQGTGRTRVIEKVPSNLQNDVVSRTRAEYHDQINLLARRMQQLKPERVTIKRRMRDGEPDEERVGQALYDLSCGNPADEEVFIQRIINERDTALLITVSQVKPLLRRGKEGKKPLDYVQAAFVYMAEAQRVLGDNFALFGYGSNGPREVFVDVFKPFEEPWSGDTDFRLGNLSATKDARTGAVYRHIAQVFGSRPEERRIHIDIIGKIADDKDYAGEPALQDTIEAAALERARGIELFALSVNPEVTGEKLERVYGLGRFLQTDPTALPQAVITLYEALTL